MKKLHARIAKASFWWWSFGLWFGVLFVLSSFGQSSTRMPKVEHLDKILHAGYFFGGGIIFISALILTGPRNASPRWKWILPLTVVMAALAGVFDEWHQTFTPGRDGGDAGDVLADVFGGILAGLVAYYAYPHVERFRIPPATRSDRGASQGA